ncbi:MAG: tetratricopeptide repeat protein [Desulfovibrionales bacterium]
MPKIRIPARSLFSLGEWLSASGDVREGLAAYHRLIKTHPNDNLVPRAYFEAARIYNDRMTDPEKAKRILSGVVKKYPDHDVIPTVRDYLENSLTL